MANDTNDYKTITMENILTGERTEMVVAGTATGSGGEYLLVFNVAEIHEPEAEASVLKVVREAGNELFYAEVGDEAELAEAAALFADLNDEFTIEL